MLFKEIQISLIYLLALQNNAFGIDVRGLPGPMEPGVSVRILGYVWQWGKEFQLNLHKEKFWNDDVYFHMRVGYNSWDDTISFDTWKAEGEGGRGQWEDEEKHYGVPARYNNGLFSNTGFRMRITAREDHFQIFLNGKELTFAYRMTTEELKDIKFLSIVGKYTAESITWQREVGPNEYVPYK